MERAVVLLGLVSAIVAEAPYHLPRPAPQVPAFHYPSAPAPPSQPSRPHPHFPSQPTPHLPSPQPNFNLGYNYERPSVQPAFVQPPQPQIQYNSPPQQIHRPHSTYSQPQQALSQSYPQPQPISHYPQPSHSYGLPQLQIAPRPAQQPIPQIQQHVPQIAPQHIYSQPQPQFQPQPQPQPAQVYQPAAYQQQQFNSQPGYSYQQPHPIQALQQLPLQAHSLNSGISSSLSSYQADSNQYRGSHDQTHNEALDSVVIDHLQHIIREDEHSLAKSAGYQSLVSGISLENAKPSVEISSFIQNSPLGRNQNTGPSESHRSISSSTAVAVSGPSVDYGLPSITANSQSSHGSSSSSFVPQTHSGISYGAPSQH
ncbi:uncharacterized protein LOC131844544 [Achroia grisella]|uniref:uncharacterized protein LOC131844544 n=1 Tax=Achroia grisella TaxID=688607 RepID=UPI0027D23E09|nr:uncharacterized protein LOC131844544 [Achroia grisella]